MMLPRPTPTRPNADSMEEVKIAAVIRARAAARTAPITTPASHKNDTATNPAANKNQRPGGAIPFVVASAKNSLTANAENNPTTIARNQFGAKIVIKMTIGMAMAAVRTLCHCGVGKLEHLALPSAGWRRY